MSRDHGIVCVHCGYEPTVDETYNTGWAYSMHEGLDHYECDDCGKITVVSHFNVKHFENVDKYEAQEYLELSGLVKDQQG